MQEGELMMGRYFKNLILIFAVLIVAVAFFVLIALVVWALSLWVGVPLGPIIAYMIFVILGLSALMTFGNND